MLRLRKVAIIGAGPAGLVTAKTLLQNFPQDTFAPTIFERRHEIGGLWPSRPTTNGRTISAKKHDSAGSVNPSMRTNLSRYTVAFSDLSWESVFESQDVPMFLQAWQVGMYLEKYVERYIPPGMIKLGHNVVQAIRSDTEMRWTVKWVVESDHQESQVMSDCFDYLVVASGFFSTPYIPDIPGLSSFKESTIHSMALDTPGILQSIIPELKTAGRKLVVIGGSMSGAEAASTLALQLSSEKHAACPSSPRLKDHEVHHISTKPFWAIPTYLPQITIDESSGKEEAASFLPLDLVFYNLSHRPPGPVQYSFGPLSIEQISQLNDRFRSLLGSEYGTYGHVNSKTDRLEKDKPQPTFLAIGNDYAEFVRSKAISPTIGRVCGVTLSPSDSVRVDIRLPDGEMTMLDDVAAIIMATGFTPHKSLSFLPEEVLSTLEYVPTDSFLPLILDEKGSTHAEIPDLGFVGFYKGPYWGAMEMQARLLGETWATVNPGDTRHLSNAEMTKRAEERRVMRDFRSADPDFYRGQLPMADYTGLMESFARDLGIPRAQLADLGERDGPVVPARFSSDRTPLGPAHDIKENEVKATLDSLRTTLNPKNSITSPGLAMAIFRALHGPWKFTRTFHDKAQSQDEEKVFGTAAFHPRYPSRIEYEKEYLYEEIEHDIQAPNTERRYRSAYSLLDSIPRSDSTYIHRWLTDENSKDQFLYGLAQTYIQQKVRNGMRVPGEYTVFASGSGRTDDGLAGDVSQYEYVFNMEGVAITSWECSMVYKEAEMEIRTSYTR